MIIRIRPKPLSASQIVVLALIVLAATGVLMGQLQQSGGPGSTVTANAGTNLNTSGLALETGGNLAAIKTKTDNLDVLLSTRLKPADTLAAVTTVTTVGAVTAITNALPTGANILGWVRVVPPGCASLTTQFANATVGVAITTGTTVTSTTTCVTWAYANNITNSPVTLRLADKAGTPVIWLGGAADFSIPANSNIQVPVQGVTFTSGITAIAGTAAAINLQINGLQ